MVEGALRHRMPGRKRLGTTGDTDGCSLSPTVNMENAVQILSGRLVRRQLCMARWWLGWSWWKTTQPGVVVVGAMAGRGGR